MLMMRCGFKSLSMKLERKIWNNIQYCKIILEKGKMENDEEEERNTGLTALQWSNFFLLEAYFFI